MRPNIDQKVKHVILGDIGIVRKYDIKTDTAVVSVNGQIKIWSGDNMMEVPEIEDKIA